MQHEVICRKRLLEKLALRIAESPVTVLLGARQVGKTTLADKVEACPLTKWSPKLLEEVRA